VHHIISNMVSAQCTHCKTAHCKLLLWMLYLTLLWQ